MPTSAQNFLRQSTRLLSRKWSDSCRIYANNNNNFKHKKMKTTMRKAGYRLASTFMAMIAIMALSFTATSCSSDDDDNTANPSTTDVTSHSYDRVWKVDNTADIADWGAYGEAYFDLTVDGEMHIGIKPGPLMARKFGVDQNKVYNLGQITVKIVADDGNPNAGKILLDGGNGKTFEWARYSLAKNRMTITTIASESVSSTVMNCSATSAESFAKGEKAPNGLTDYHAIAQTEEVTLKKVWKSVVDKDHVYLYVISDNNIDIYLTEKNNTYKHVAGGEIELLTDATHTEGKFIFDGKEKSWSKLTKSSVIFDGEKMNIADVYFFEGKFYNAY